MNAQRLTELKVLAEKATKGCWQRIFTTKSELNKFRTGAGNPIRVIAAAMSGTKYSDVASGLVECVVAGQQIGNHIRINERDAVYDSENITYIAAACPETMLALIAHIEALESDYKTLESEYQATCKAGLATVDELENADAELAAIKAQEPVAWMSDQGLYYSEEAAKTYRESIKSVKPLYAQPVAPQTVPDEWRETMQDLVDEVKGAFCPADMCAKSGVCCKEYAKQLVADAERLLQSAPAQAQYSTINTYALQQYSIIQRWSGQHNFVAGNDDFWRLAVMLADAASVERVYPKAVQDQHVAIIAEAGALFRHYEQLHRAKGTADGDEKAERNRQMAEKIESVLSGVSSAPKDDNGLVNALLSGVSDEIELDASGYWTSP